MQLGSSEFETSGLHADAICGRVFGGSVVGGGGDDVDVDVVTALTALMALVLVLVLVSLLIAKSSPNQPRSGDRM